jgi:hypothetical protein
MKKVFGFIAFLLVLTVAVSLFAQIPPTTGQRGQFVRPIYLVEKDSTAKYLALTAAQKPKVNAVIDSVLKVWKPYIDELNVINKKYGYPETPITGAGVGMGGGRGGGGGGGGVTLTAEQRTARTAENTALRDKYLPKQPQLDKFYADIQKLLTPDQVTKFNDTQAFNKPTFVAARRGGN